MIDLTEAWFIARDGMVASAMMTCCGPFGSEQAAKDAAVTLQPGSYRIFGPAPAGVTFAIAAPVVTFNSI